MNENRSPARPDASFHAWSAAWRLALPLVWCLIIAKLFKVQYTNITWLGTGPDDDGPKARPDHAMRLFVARTQRPNSTAPKPSSRSRMLIDGAMPR